MKIMYIYKKLYSDAHLESEYTISISENYTPFFVNIVILYSVIFWILIYF